MKIKRGPDEDLAGRLAAARELVPPDGSCRACFTAGRDGAIAVIEAARELADKLAAARRLQSRHFHAGDNSFAVGRDAAIAAVTEEA